MTAASMPNSTVPNSTVPQGSVEQWRDKKRYLWLIGLVVPSLALVAFVGYQLTGWSVWVWLGPIVILGIVPAIDLATGLDRSNPPDDAIEALENDKYYRWITYAFLPIQYVGFVAAMIWIAKPEWLGVDAVGTWEKIGIAVSIGCIGGIGINTAHELGHKREANERWLSKIALAQSFYGHFYIEHNRGHHVRVATPEDPASSRLGENFYAFWPRTVWGSLKSAWKLEKKRYARKNTHPFHLGNDVLNAWLMSAVLFGGLIAILGVGVTPYLVIQAIVGFSLLEVVNYMEHYGMLRQKVGAAGKQRYERVDPSHSWNSNNIATNVLLYHLQRHSDHHANPTRRYQTLRDFEESPVLPTGYAGMIVLAIFPPIWRRVMDPRVLAHFGGDVTRANIAPRKREKILAKYGAAAGTSVEVRKAADGSGFAARSARTSTTETARSARTSTTETAATPVEVRRALGEEPRNHADGSGFAARSARTSTTETARSARTSTTDAEAGTSVEVDEVLAARCPGCDYIYEVVVGNELEGFAAGTAWNDIPGDWCCPDCGVREKVDFIALTHDEATS